MSVRDRKRTVLLGSRGSSCGMGGGDHVARLLRDGDKEIVNFLEIEV